MRVVRRSAFAASPWKNGGGITHEIARAGGEVFDWRLSVAEVGSDGPFSLFPHHQRWLTVIEGNGMVLEGAGAPLVCDVLQPVHFSGSEALFGRLRNGPCRDFNVIYNPQRIAAHAKVVRSVGHVGGNQFSGVLIVSGQSDTASAGDFVWLDSSADTVSFVGDGAVVVGIKLSEQIAQPQQG